MQNVVPTRQKHAYTAQITLRTQNKYLVHAWSLQICACFNVGFKKCVFDDVFGDRPKIFEIHRKGELVVCLDVSVSIQVAVIAKIDAQAILQAASPSQRRC